MSATVRFFNKAVNQLTLLSKATSCWMVWTFPSLALQVMQVVVWQLGSGGAYTICTLYLSAYSWSDEVHKQDTWGHTVGCIHFIKGQSYRQSSCTHTIHTYRLANRHTYAVSVTHAFVLSAYTWQKITVTYLDWDHCWQSPSAVHPWNSQSLAL